MSPKVTIGIPVYNGEKYLAQTLDSILSQTFDDFVLYISDNASDDGTQAICSSYVAHDERVQYFRNEVNVGAAKNYNLLVDMAKTKYFKWAAADDLMEPEFLERCVEPLEKNDAYVLAYPLSIVIDENGHPFKELRPIMGLDASQPHRRFLAHVGERRVNQNSVFGVIRTHVLKQTRLIGAFSSSDRVLNAELTLHGQFFEVDDVLFYKRTHPGAHWKTHRTLRERNAWYDPDLKGTMSYPTWRLMQEHLISIQRAPISRTERILCGVALVPWMRNNWRKLATLS